MEYSKENIWLDYEIFLFLVLKKEYFIQDGKKWRIAMRWIVLLLIPLSFILPSCHIIREMKHNIDESTEAVQRNKDTVNESSRVIQHNYETIDRSSKAIERNRRAIDASSQVIENNGLIVQASTEAILSNQRSVSGSTEAILRNAEAVEDSTSLISSLKPDPEVLIAAIPIVLFILLSPFILMLLLLWRIDRRLKKMSKG